MTFKGVVRLAAFGCLLAGCANKYDSVTPELQASMLDDLKAGKQNLDCGQKCLFTWAAQAGSIHALDLAENWTALAVRVMQIGYGEDLSYYYLGQAAQGLGYHPAAIIYYGTALQLSTGLNPLTKCASGQSTGNDPCQGVDIVGSIPVLIQASRDAMAQQAAQQAAEQAAAAPPPVAHPRRRHHAPAAPSAAPADSSDGTGGSGLAMPPPPTTSP